MAPTEVPLAEVASMADLLARNAHLDRPFLPDTDYTEEESKEVQSQIGAISILPSRILDPIYLAFSAKHLPAVAAALRTLDPVTQRMAFSTLIQILSLLPDPKDNPYFRRFLRSRHFDGLPTVIARAWHNGTHWLRPSGPGHHCTLIIHTLFWCDVAMGDDRRASVDRAVRASLAQKLQDLQARETFPRLDERQRVEIARLLGTLQSVENMPGPPGYYLTSTREHLEEQVAEDECVVCMGEAQFACSKCKMVRYCGTECQAEAWTQGHKIRCFAVAY